MANASALLASASVIVAAYAGMRPTITVFDNTPGTRSFTPTVSGNYRITIVGASSSNNGTPAGSALGAGSTGGYVEFTTGLVAGTPYAYTIADTANTAGTTSFAGLASATGGSTNTVPIVTGTSGSGTSNATAGVGTGPAGALTRTGLPGLAFFNGTGQPTTIGGNSAPNHFNNGQQGQINGPGAGFSTAVGPNQLGGSSYVDGFNLGLAPGAPSPGNATSGAAPLSGYGCGGSIASGASPDGGIGGGAAPNGRPGPGGSPGFGGTNGLGSPGLIIIEKVN